jgi:hypothetical protein
MLQVQESILQRIGKALRVQSNDITDQPVPTRWVDLILHLDEQERKRAERRGSEPGPRQRRAD